MRFRRTAFTMLPLLASFAATSLAQEGSPATGPGSDRAGGPPAAAQDPFGAPGGASLGDDPFGGAAGPGGQGPFEVGGQTAPGGFPPNPRFIASGSIILTWSQKNDIAWGFSKNTGRWTRQQLDPPASEAPTVGSDLGVIRGGSTIYAYSGQTGRWDVLRLPEDHKPQFTIHGDFVVVNDGQDIYTFANSTGRWTTPDGAQMNGAEDAAGFGGMMGGYSAEMSGMEMGFGGGMPAMPGGFEGMMGGYGRPGSSHGDGEDKDPSELRRTFEELDRQAARLAEQYRSQAATRGRSHPQLRRLRQELTQAVAKAFRARQELHQAELAEFRRRMNAIQQTLQARDRLQDEIVQRRVEELLNPSLRWDASEPTAAAALSADQSTAPSPGAMPGGGTPFPGAGGPMPLAPGAGSLFGAPTPGMPPGAADARSLEAARKTSANNLKQLMLAMHMYHDQHKRFPPAVVLGKNGKGGPPHSWRVELLPYLDQQELYDAYRFDEPWDSPANRKVLEQMPAVFRSPRDAPDSINASYFALVTPGLPPDWGSGTLFSRPQGTPIQEIFDGTSNTIALVEAKRNIPWTRPHDIPYLPDQGLPVLGGWFPDGWHAGLADGSVRFIPADADETPLRALFSIAGGEPINTGILFRE